MTQFDTRDLRAWALKGAEQRLVEIAAEAAAIHGAFPELRNSGRAQEREGRTAGVKGEEKAAAKSTSGKRARKGGMSAAMRKAVGERMRKYWAARRAAAQQEVQGPAPEDASGAPVEGSEPARQHEAAGDPEAGGRTRRKSARGGQRTAGGQGARGLKRPGRKGRTAPRAARRSARG